MRRAARTDRNQQSIVMALRKIGATVEPIQRLGRGVPDLLCGYRGRNILLEVKDPQQPAAKCGLTEDEREWHAMWRGQVAIVYDANEAIHAVAGAPT
jgi:hypothetical protein